MSVLDSNTNSLSSTYHMQKISKSVSDVKVPGWWITICPVDIGKLSLRENRYMLSPRAVTHNHKCLNCMQGGGGG